MTGFNDPFVIARCLVNLLNPPKDAKIVDFGCGTGLCGIELQKVGFTNIYGIDGSHDMLEIAKTKNIYKDAWVCLVGLDPLPEAVPLNCDIAVASAVMIKGHFPNTCYVEMLKTVISGGHIAFTIRDIYLDHSTDNGMNFKDALEELEASGKMQLVKRERYVKYKGLAMGSGHQEEGANILIYKKL